MRGVGGHGEKISRRIEREKTGGRGEESDVGKGDEESERTRGRVETFTRRDEPPGRRNLSLERRVEKRNVRTLERKRGEEAKQGEVTRGVRKAGESDGGD